MWLIFSVVLSSAAQQCDSVMLSYSFSCVLSVDTEYSSLCSTEGLCVFHSSVSPTPSPPLPHSLPHGNLMSWPLLVLDELSYPLLLRKPHDTYQKREIKWRIVLGLGIGEVPGKSSGWLVCVSDSPRILEATALPPLKRTQWGHLQRTGSWVPSSWGCISPCMIEEMTGLAWHRQCKCLELFRYQ